MAQSSWGQSSTGSKVDIQINTLSGEGGGAADFKCSICFKSLRRITGNSAINFLKFTIRVREGHCMYSLRALKKSIYANVQPQNRVVLD